MASLEFADWIAYYNAEPFGYEMQNFRHFESTAAIVSQVAATIPRARGKSVKKAKASDYYPATTKKNVVHLTPEQKEHLRKKHGKRRNSKR